MKKSDKNKEQLLSEIDRLKKKLSDLKKSNINNPPSKLGVPTIELLSDDNYKSIFEGASDGIVYVDAAAKILNINPAFTEITGIPGGKIIGKSGIELAKKYISTIKNADVLNLINEAVSKASNKSYEIKSNNQVFEITSRKLKNGNRVAVIRNITKRKQAEDALSETENRLKFLAENAKDMIYRMSIPDGKYEFVSPASHALFGYTPQEFYESPVLIQKTMHPDWSDYFEKEWQKLLKGKMPPVYEYKIIHKSGNVKWLHQRNVLIKDEENKPIAIEGIVSDITQDKLDQEAILQSEIKYRALFEKSADAMLIIADNRFIDCNIAALDLLGCSSKQEILNTHPSKISPKFQEDGRDSIEKANEMMNIAHMTGNHRFEWNHTRINGEIFPAEILLTAIHIRDKDMLHVVMRDISERKNAETSLKNSEWYYRALFENSPVPLWEEDFSEIKKEIDEVKKNGVTDFRKYFDEKPHLIPEYVQKLKVLEVNQPALKLHGAKNKTELLQGLHSIFTDRSNDGFKNGLIAVANGNMNAEFDGIVKKLSGEELTVHMRWAVVPGYEKTMQKVFVSTIDISDRMLAERALKEQVKFNELLMNTITDGYVLTTAEGKIVQVNASYCQMIQYDQEELLKMNIYDLDAHFDQKEIEERTEKFMHSGKAKFETKQKSKNGDLIDFEVSTVILKNPDGDMAASFLRDITERKKAELELRKSEEKLRNIFANSTNLFYAHTPDHKLTYLSPQVKEILGYTEEEAKVKWTKLLTDNPDNELGIQYTQKAIDTGNKQPPYKLELLKKTGEKIWVEVREVPIVKDGKTISIVGALIDITERINAEKAILEREHLLLESQKVSNTGSYVLDFRSGFWESSEMLLYIFGIDKAYKTNIEGWLKLIHPDDREMMQTYLSENILKKFEPFNKEYRIIRANDKKECWVLGMGRLEIDKNGVPVKMIGTIQDVTKRKLIDEAFRESELKYRSLFENSNDAIYFLYNNKFEVINNKFTEMFGYTLEEINKPGFGYEHLVAPKSKNVFIGRQEQFKKGKIEENKYEMTLLTKAGKEIEVEISDSFLDYKDGIANQGYIRDITARKKQQEILMNAIVEVQEAEKYKFGNELHDGLGQVLITVSMYLESLSKIKNKLDDNKKTDLRQAQELNKQAMNDARRISHGLMITGIDEHGILYLIKQLCYYSSGPEITFSFLNKNIDEKKISTDFKVHLYRIIQELSSNILKHANASKAKIKLISDDDNHLKLYVSDNGKGFDRNKVVYGAGLHNIDQRVKIMKGSIEIQSEKAKGTMISISIPL